MRLIGIGLVAAALLFPTTNLALARDDEKVIDKKAPDKEPETDKEFLVQAIACEVFNVKMADAAMKRATSEDVRSLAAKIKEDHTKIRDSFQEQAKKWKVAVVEGTSRRHREEADRLKKLEGHDYDVAYTQFVVDGHEKGLALYKKWSKDATDSGLKEEAKNAASTYENHKEHTKKVCDKLKN